MPKKNIKTSDAIVIGISSVAVVAVIASLKKTISKHNAEKAKIEAKEKAEIHAIQTAGKIVTTKIQNGFYDASNYQDIITDFEFYQIAILESK